MHDSCTFMLLAILTFEIVVLTVNNWILFRQEVKETLILLYSAVPCHLLCVSRWTDCVSFTVWPNSLFYTHQCGDASWHSQCRHNVRSVSSPHLRELHNQTGEKGKKPFCDLSLSLWFCIFLSFCLSVCTLVIAHKKLESPDMGKVAEGVRAALPSPISACNIPVFFC